MTSTPVYQPPGIDTPTGRFCSWLILGESELARGTRARAWNVARRIWGKRKTVTLADEIAVREWLRPELEDIVNLASKGQNPILREEALRVRVGIVRPDNVDVRAVTKLLVRLYHASSSELLAEGWTDVL